MHMDFCFIVCRIHLYIDYLFICSEQNKEQKSIFHVSAKGLGALWNWEKKTKPTADNNIL